MFIFVPLWHLFLATYTKGSYNEITSCQRCIVILWKIKQMDLIRKVSTYENENNKIKYERVG